MKRMIRIAAFAFALLLVFLAAVIATNIWLRKQNEQLLQETIRSRTAQFTEILALTKAGPPPWSESFTQQLGQALGAEIIVRDSPPPAGRASATTRGSRWRFDHVFLDTEGNPVGYAQVSLPPPATVRAMVLLQHISALLLSTAFLFLLILLLFVVLDRRWLHTDDTREGAQTATPNREFTVLSHLAERSVQQSAELKQERGDRQRAEADIHLKQILLNRALEEKIEMGRDLHDGLIQSLYATGLTIQASRKALDHDPVVARNQMDNALQTLNAAIREVRTYISGLGSEQLKQRSFAASVLALAQNLAAGREIAFELRIDEEAARHIPPDSVTDLLQIVREAISNSLRHGGAHHVSVRLHREGNALALLVQDDGSGFDLKNSVRGRGLDNMQARASRIGASLRCHSEAGAGTRIVLEFAAAPQPENQ